MYTVKYHDGTEVKSVNLFNVDFIHNGTTVVFSNKEGEVQLAMCASRYICHIKNIEGK
jgi:hypothetical protein